MLTAEENELLTRVGPGTPCGEYFRRYWHPVAMLPELSATAPTKFVRMLGEDLVLFCCAEGPGDRGQGTGDGQGHFLAPDPRSQAPVRVGLIGDHCSHRGASLLYGRVEERGIACAYHGWLYDTQGNCLETPAEPADSLLHLTVKHKAYPVREHYGMYWTYMGPLPAPVLPRYDLAEMGPIRAIKLTPQFDCNWLQILENHVDQSHPPILHQDTEGGAEAVNTTRGRIDEVKEMEYLETPWGIRRRQERKGWADLDLIAFPCTQRIFNDFSIKVPIDDTHTRQYSIYTELPADGSQPSNGESSQAIEYYVESPGDGKTPPDAIHPIAKYRMDALRFQDVMALETQGPIADRTIERLATADKGVVMLREMVKREIEKVQRGLDPLGVVREPGEEVIDTFFPRYVELVRRGEIRPPHIAGGIHLFTGDEQASVGG